MSRDSDQFSTVGLDKPLEDLKETGTVSLKISHLSIGGGERRELSWVEKTCGFLGSARSCGRCLTTWEEKEKL